MDAPNDPNLAQVQQHLLRLVDSVDRIHTQVSALTVRLETDSLQINALVRHLTDTQSTRLLQERLADFVEQLAASHEQLYYLTGRLNQLATQEQLVRLASQMATQERLGELSATLDNLGRSQERANRLAETKEQQLESALTMLREIFQQRTTLEEKQQARTVEEDRALCTAARGELAVDLLPVLDQLETNLADGQALLEKRRAETGLLANAMGGEGSSAAASASASGGGSIFARWRARMGPEITRGMDPESIEHLRRLPESLETGVADLERWLGGLALLRDRVLGILRREGIEPIIALHQLFDARLHLAVGQEPRTDLAPQTVVREVRKGFRQGERTLRHCEVIVAQRPSAKRSSPAEGHSGHSRRAVG